MHISPDLPCLPSLLLMQAHYHGEEGKSVCYEEEGKQQCSTDAAQFPGVPMLSPVPQSAPPNAPAVSDSAIDDTHHMLDQMTARFSSLQRPVMLCIYIASFSNTKFWSLIH